MNFMSSVIGSKIEQFRYKLLRKQHKLPLFNYEKREFAGSGNMVVQKASEHPYYTIQFVVIQHCMSKYSLFGFKGYLQPKSYHGTYPENDKLHSTPIRLALRK